MAFTSTPLYLDPSLPNSEQQNQHQGFKDHGNQQHLPPPRVLLPPSPAPVIRPGSMSGRAGLARIATTEGGLKCPRCDSTNTKFCYFNNYSLSQPRHFCKTCRRYWTRGGALRNVPVGGGFRKTTKRSQSSSSKRSAAITTSFYSTDCYLSTSSSSTPNSMPGLHQVVGGHYGVPGLIGLSSGGSSEPYMEVRMGASPNGGEGSILPIGFMDAQWKVTPPQVTPPPQVHQFPFLAGLGTRAGYIHPSDGKQAGVEAGSSDDRTRITKPITNSSGVISTQMVPVKNMEDQRLNTGRSFMGLSGDQDQDQYWGAGNAWTADLSAGLSSSSTTNIIALRKNI